MMSFKNTAEFAKSLDEQDELRKFRDQFYFPKHKHEPVLYFTGNSLGLQPKTVKNYIEVELEDWAIHGVEGHFNAKNPWFSYHERSIPALATLTGAKNCEVVAMNALTVNLHILFATFFNPSKTRYKILFEKKAFPSDVYMLESQAIHHKLSPEKCLMEIDTLAGEDKILEIIHKHRDELALIFMGGVNYYTGQVLDMHYITKQAHKHGIKVGFDLAHAIGNIPLQLHTWGVDFAAWCSYKYLNSGPGGVSGIFIHEKHVTDKSLHRLSGWWGYNKQTRFLMQPGFDPIPTAEGWQMSNAPIINLAIHQASLDIFMEAGFEKLRNKSMLLTAYLEYILHHASSENSLLDLEVLTPKNPLLRGCQLSVVFKKYGKQIFEYLNSNGVITDWREPDVIRFAPVPLYNSFTDVWKMGEILKKFTL